MKRPRQSRLQKLVKGCMHLGKYPAVGSVALLLGCLPDPNLLSVSPDGRYVAVPVNAKGEVAFDEKEPSRCVLIDLETGGVRVFNRPLTQAMWLSCADGKVAVMAQEPGREGSAIVVEGIEPELVLEESMFPNLSSKADKLVYVNPKEQEGRLSGLLVRDLKTGDVSQVAASGTVGVFSPDGLKLAYVVGEDHRLGLFVGDSKGGAGHRLATIECDEDKGRAGGTVKDHLIMPFWMDNEHLVFSTSGPKTGNDNELFLVDMKGHVEQLTDNDFDETQPGMTADGRLVYLKRGDRFLKNDMPGIGTISFASKTDHGWEHKATEIHAVFFKVTGNQIACVDVDQTDGKVTKTRLFLADLDSGKVVRDLGQLISEKAGKELATLPASTQPATK